MVGIVQHGGIDDLVMPRDMLTILGFEVGLQGVFRISSEDCCLPNADVPGWDLA